MNIGKYVPTVATLIVAAVVLAGVAFPMIGNLSSETTTISNDGASWIRMAYMTDQSDYSVEYSFGDNISVAGQSGEWEDMILYADSQCTICIVGDYLVKIIGDVAYTDDDPQTVTVSRSSGIVSIDGEPVSESTVSWAYVPVANGVYGSFGGDAVPLHRDASNVAVAGGFAGVYAYNEDVSMDLGFVMDADVTEEYINSVRWALESDTPLQKTQPISPDEIKESDPSSLKPTDIDPITPIKPVENLLKSTSPDGDWEYEVRSQDNTTVRIYQYNGTGGNIVVPATIDGYTVYEIDNPYGVFPNTISANSTITFSDGITRIGALASNNTKITGSVVIPNSVTMLGDATFYGCSGLNGTVTLSSNLVYLGYNVFHGCSNLTGTITIPTGVTQLQYGTFYNCSKITNFVLHDGITAINPRSDMGRTNATFGNCTSWVTTLSYPASLTQLGSAFAGCTGLTGNIYLPAGLTMLGSGVFCGCTGLTGTVTIPSAITEIGSDVFSGCTGLTGVQFHNNITRIGASAFYHTGITSLTLPTALTYLGNTAFKWNANLTGTVTIPSGITTLNSGVFQDCTGLTGVVFNESITTIKERAFQDCSGLTGALIIPASVTTIEGGAFSGTGYSSLNLNNVTKLKTTVPGGGTLGAFDGCENMTGTLIIPETLTTISQNSFRGTGFEYLIVLSDAVLPDANQYNGVFKDASINQVLNLGSAEYTTTSYGLNADEVRSDIEATSYMAPVSISETTPREGLVYDVVAILPIIFVAGLLLTTAWLFIRK